MQPLGRQLSYSPDIVGGTGERRSLLRLDAQVLYSRPSVWGQFSALMQIFSGKADNLSREEVFSRACLGRLPHVLVPIL